MSAGSPAWIMGDKEPAQYYWQHSYDRVWHPTYAQELELLHGHYAAMSYWDAQVGRLLNVLERKGLREDTIVVITTDHGFSDGQHGYWGKHNMWDVALHVPLILHVPGLTPSAATTRRLSEHVDLYPTLCDLCGLSTPDFVEGTSLMPLLEDPGRPWKEAVFAWRRPMYHDLHQAYHEARGMRTDRYRFTDYVDSEDQVLFTELFDHAADGHETVNLALDPGNRALVAELRSLLGHGWRACTTTGFPTNCLGNDWNLTQRRRERKEEGGDESGRSIFNCSAFPLRTSASLRLRVRYRNLGYLCCAAPSWAVYDASRCGAGVIAVRQHPVPIDPDIAHADRKLVWIGEGGAIADGFRIEDHHVGVETSLQKTAIANAQPRRHGPAHLADRVFQGEHLLLAHILAQHARVGAIGAWMHGSQRHAPGRIEPPASVPIVIHGCCNCRRMFCSLME